MSIQFDRHYKVTAYQQRPDVQAFGETIGAGIEITGLRMQCKIEKTLKSEPNTCELTIYNLAEQTRAAFQKLPIRVVVQAGYQDVLSLLFVGDVRPGFARSKHEGADWTTKLILGDGLRAFSQARTNRSYRKGTPLINIVRDLARTMSFPLPPEVEENPKLKQPIASSEVAVGWSADELDRILAPFGYQWASQNGGLQLFSDEGVLAKSREREIGEHTGMIESPEIGTPEKKATKPPSIKIKHLLYPEITPGERILLIAADDQPRRFLVEHVTHTLDTDDNDWTTEIEARPL